MNETDSLFDFIVIGSGFGGSVSALRLSEKGYRVLVIEQGRRYRQDEFPKSDWELSKYLWNPKLGWRGFLNISFFKKAFVLSGVGVGGGSLVYAATLMKPGDQFFSDPGWPAGIDWKKQLEPYFERSRQMLGAAQWNPDGQEDLILQQVAADMNAAGTFRGVDLGIYQGNPDTETDPYFQGEGPSRKGCSRCAGCITGCREGGKNSLDKNYLWFAEKHGTIILDQHKAFKIKLENTVYSVFTKGIGFKKKKNVFYSKNLIISANVLGTTELLLLQRDRYKTLPLLSPTLGFKVRTNSEALSGVALSSHKLNNGPAITACFCPEPGTMVQPVKFNDASGAVTHLAGMAAEGRSPLFRCIKGFLVLFTHPLQALRILAHPRWCSNSLVLMVMQNHESSMQLKLKKGILKSTLTFSGKDGKVPTFIKAGQETAKRYAALSKGIPMNCITELIANKATTAHLIGGCPMSEIPENGVVDRQMRVFNYPGLYVIDSSVIPANPGVNPSLTIAALAEYAMDQIPGKTEL